MKDSDKNVGYVVNHLDMKKKHNVFVGSCPFHGENTESFVVNPKSHDYVCFSCGANGDLDEVVDIIVQRSA